MTEQRRSTSVGPLMRELLSHLQEATQKEKPNDSEKSLSFDWNSRKTPFSDLENGSYRFSPMFRSFIPKSQKPESLRPITQPAKKDIRILATMSLLVNQVYESIFLDSFHGFRKGRGVQTLFREEIRQGGIIPVKTREFYREVLSRQS